MITTQKTKALFIALAFTIVVSSCNHKKADLETTVKDNVSTTISEDTARLARMISLEKYRPKAVKFQYVFIDNSGSNERISVPGPSDYNLQAILYFDSATFEKLLDFNRNADFPSPCFNKSYFEFDWLTPAVKEELTKSDTAYHGQPDFFFGTGSKGKLWLLDKKVLVECGSI